MALLGLGLFAILIIVQISREQNHYGPSSTLTRLKNKDVVTEEEFLKSAHARNPAVAIRCREIFAEQCDITQEYIHPDDRLIEDLRLD